MKNLLTLAFVLFFILKSFATPNSKDKIIDIKYFGDTSKVKIDNTFLLLGTLFDCEGATPFSIKNVFDTYQNYEWPLIEYIDSIAKMDFKTNLTKQWGNYYADKLTKKMDSLYKGRELIDSLFNSDEKKMSFILGVYLRYGEKLKDNIYKIQLVNSPKHKNVYNILKELNCEDILFKKINSIPNLFIIYFKSTDLIDAYFATVDIQKKKLNTEKTENSNNKSGSHSTWEQRRDLPVINLFTRKDGF